MGNALKDRLQELADTNERSLSDFVRLICKDYLEALDEQEAADSE
jgi:predicted transcriptional regulator